MQQQMRRRGFTIGLLSLGVLAGVALTASLAQAASGPGPYYAEPAWDQKLAAATRFLVLSNFAYAAVLDKETGLVWEKSPDSLAAWTWANARSVCLNKAVGGRKGWRLPSIPELASLIDLSAATTLKLPPVHPFLNVRDTYWSASTDATVPSDAWYLLLSTGELFPSNKASSFYIWCVRGGMNADVY